MTLGKFVNPSSLELISKSLKNGDKVLVTGASGWVGKTTCYLLSELGVPFYPVATYGREIQIGNRKLQIYSMDDHQIKYFSPSIFVDAAYLTREFSNEMPISEYISKNREVTQKSIDLIRENGISQYIGFSSGVTLTTSIEENEPYSMVKRDFEKQIDSKMSELQTRYSVGRIWSISGGLVDKIDGFAFSDIVSQAIKGRIVLKSSKPVIRRYCLVDEMLAIAFANTEKNMKIFDTGGPLTEIHEFANMVSQIVGVNSIANSEIDHFEIPDTYFSSNRDWKYLTGLYGLKAFAIEEQIELVLRSLRERE
jgi:nucleoside-diphosphate-sugar epimerase